MTEYVTKDSGERAEFDSGMQRDTESGKPRFDLMLPEGVPFEEQMITRYAALLGRGAEKYDERNWEKANSEAELARMKSSAFRHFMQWMTGETDEDHAAAVIFNIVAAETTARKIAPEVVAQKVAEQHPVRLHGHSVTEYDDEHPGGVRVVPHFMVGPGDVHQIVGDMKRNLGQIGVENLRI